MKLARMAVSLLFALLLLATASCRLPWKRKAEPLPPTPIPKAEPKKPSRIETPTPPKIEAPPPPPSQTQPPPAVEAQSQPTVEIPEPPPPPPEKKRRRGRTKAPAPAAGPPPEAAPQVPPQAPPQLGQIMTTGEQREYTRALEGSLRETRRILARVSSKRLTAEQTQVLTRIRTFMHQAEASRREDLVAAANLAHRAELLARDLVAQLQ